MQSVAGEIHLFNTGLMKSSIVSILFLQFIKIKGSFFNLYFDMRWMWIRQLTLKLLHIINVSTQKLLRPNMDFTPWTLRVKDFVASLRMTDIL